ncbi:MAG: hypothetical protein U0Z26_17465 [Anaerolineales bacterium]
MSINIIKKPEWGLLYYHFQDYCTSAETVKATQEATKDYPKGKLTTIFNLLKCKLDIEKTNDVRQIIAENKRLFENGIITTHAAILTQNESLTIFLKAFELLMVDVPTKIRIFSSLSDGLAWIGLREHEQELYLLLNKIPKHPERA